jgi:molecular chaperone DnaK (HSP70)
MKTKEISFAVIQQIKKNNKLAEQFESIEKIIEDIYFNYPDIHKLEIEQIKKDIRDYAEDFEQDFGAESFIYLIWQFVQLNQALLEKNSQNLLKD